jgi:glyoxylase-like metal-dependent hydrolase (beta-lactamase superfamily II)
MTQLRAAIVPVTLFSQNCTLLWADDTKHGVVIDPGGDLERIQEAIKQTGITVERILITHGHIDHAGGAAELKEALGVPIEGPHRADLPLLERLPETGRGYGINDARVMTPDRWLDERDQVEIAGLSFDVLHCPGHSPGSVVFIHPEKTLAIVGDVLFQGSVGRTDLPGGSHEALIHSIKSKLLPLPDETPFICGHGPTSTIGHERASNPFLR